MADLGGAVQWRPAMLCQREGEGAAFRGGVRREMLSAPRDVGMAKSGTPPHLVLCHGVCPGQQQQPEAVGMAGLRSEMQRCNAILEGENDWLLWAT